MSLLDDPKPVSPPGQTPVLNRTAQVTAGATLLLIFMGGLVTSHQAGMSVPDWPNSYGYNMFTFPPSKWVGGIFYEHTHRLMGTVVGFCSVLMVLSAYAWGRTLKVRNALWIAAASTAAIAVLLGISAVFTPADSSAGQTVKHVLVQSAIGLIGIAVVLACATFMRNREPRLWVRRLTLAVLGLVLFQGLLGGLRVVLVKLDLAIVHACVAQAFFCVAAFTAVVTSNWWRSVPAPRQLASTAGHRLIVLGVTCALAIYLQLIVGATMRHYQAGLAIPDLPLNYGKLLPPMDAASLDRANQVRTGLELPPTTLGEIWLHFGHRIGAVLVTILLSLLMLRVLRRESDKALRNPAMVLIGLLVAQLTLGILTVLMRKPADIASTHVAVGALTLMTTFVLLVRSMRLYSPLWRTAPRGFEVSYSPNHTVVPA
jgi:cytochrome c oxidase assembly protein subunit 15